MPKGHAHGPCSSLTIRHQAPVSISKVTSSLPAHSGEREPEPALGADMQEAPASEGPQAELWVGVVLKRGQGAPCNLRCQRLVVPDCFHSTWHLSLNQLAHGSRWQTQSHPYPVHRGMSHPFLALQRDNFVLLALCLHYPHCGDSGIKLASCSALEVVVRSQGQIIALETDALVFRFQGFLAQFKEIRLPHIGQICVYSHYCPFFPQVFYQLPLIHCLNFLPKDNYIHSKILSWAPNAKGFGSAICRAIRLSPRSFSRPSF